MAGQRLQVELIGGLRRHELQALEACVDDRRGRHAGGYVGACPGEGSDRAGGQRERYGKHKLRCRQIKPGDRYRRPYRCRSSPKEQLSIQKLTDLGIPNLSQTSRPLV